MSDKFKIGGAIARQAMRDLAAKELIVRVGDHNASTPFYRGSQWSLKKEQEDAAAKVANPKKGGKTKEDKKVVFVATKRSAAQIVTTTCVDAGVSFITSKWTSGLITNFDNLMKNVKRMNDMRTAQAAGDWKEFVKHEQTAMAKELNKLTRVYGGIADLTKRPDALVIIDIKKEKNAVKEANMFKIPVIALTDTNTNPDLVQYPIATNDDSPTVVEYFVKELVNAYAAKSK